MRGARRPGASWPNRSPLAWLVRYLRRMQDSSVTVSPGGCHNDGDTLRCGRATGRPGADVVAVPLQRVRLLIGIGG
jgi:hypothetical protein